MSPRRRDASRAAPTTAPDHHSATMRTGSSTRSGTRRATGLEYKPVHMKAADGSDHRAEGTDLLTRLGEAWLQDFPLRSGQGRKPRMQEYDVAPKPHDRMLLDAWYASRSRTTV